MSYLSFSHTFSNMHSIVFHQILTIPQQLEYEFRNFIRETTNWLEPAFRVRDFTKPHSKNYATQSWIKKLGHFAYHICQKACFYRNVDCRLTSRKSSY